MLQGQDKPTNRSAVLNRKRGAGRIDEYQVASVSKALELLACFTLENPVWALADLARRLKAPKSTAHNLLRTLRQFDLVRQDAETRSYKLGPRALELGLTYVRKTEELSQVRPILRRLTEATGETSKFAVLSKDQVVILAAVESAFQLHTRGDVGTRWDLHSTSLGKAILAALPEGEAREILERRGMPAHTKRTIRDWAAMQAELAQIRQRGYALDLEENEVGVRCVAAASADPLHGSVMAFSVSGPQDRITDDRIRQIGSDVVAAIRSLSGVSREEGA